MSFEIGFFIGSLFSTAIIGIAAAVLTDKLTRKAPMPIKGLVMFALTLIASASLYKAGSDQQFIDCLAAYLPASAIVTFFTYSYAQAKNPNDK